MASWVGQRTGIPVRLASPLPPRRSGLLPRSEWKPLQPGASGKDASFDMPTVVAMQNDLPRGSPHNDDDVILKTHRESERQGYRRRCRPCPRSPAVSALSAGNSGATNAILSV